MRIDIDWVTWPGQYNVTSLHPVNMQVTRVTSL